MASRTRKLSDAILYHSASTAAMTTGSRVRTNGSVLAEDWVSKTALTK